MDIFFVIDNNYIQQCLVTLNSIFQNNSGCHRIYIYSPAISDDNMLLLDNFIKDHGSELIVDCRDDIGIDFSKMVTKQWNPIVFYKLFGMLDIKDTDRVLYLDSDIIVDGDISDFYESDFGDNYAVVVEDTGMPQIMTDTYYYMGRLGIHDVKEYFNAGVMLLNLSKIQHDYSMDDFVDVYDKYHRLFHFNEQDLLNMMWNDHLGYAHHRYNRVATDYGYRTNIEGDGDAVIYHYTINKPWSDDGTLPVEARSYTWCIDKYLTYCDLPEVMKLYELVNRRKEDKVISEISKQKRKAVYNPYHYLNGDTRLQQEVLLETCGQEAVADMVMQSKVEIERQNHIIEFLMELSLRGGLGAREYFTKKNIKKIAIYGMGRICDVVERELSSSGDIVCFIDGKKTNMPRGIDGRIYPVVNAEDISSYDIDAVVTTAIGYGTEIVENIHKFVPDNKIIPVERILFNK